MNTDLLTVPAAALIIGIAAQTVRLHIKNGHLKAHRHGRDWAITREEAERFRVTPRPVGWKKGRLRKQ